MKKLFIALIALSSASSFASDPILTFKSPTVSGPNSTMGDSRHIDLNSDKDGVCRYLGADAYVKGSLKKSKSRQLLFCSVATFDTDQFATIDEDGLVDQIYIAKTVETTRSRLKRNWACAEYKTWKDKIDEIKCIKH